MRTGLEKISNELVVHHWVGREVRAAMQALYEPREASEAEPARVADLDVTLAEPSAVIASRAEKLEPSETRMRAAFTGSFSAFNTGELVVAMSARA